MIDAEVCQQHTEKQSSEKASRMSKPCFYEQRRRNITFSDNRTNRKQKKQALTKNKIQDAVATREEALRGGVDASDREQLMILKPWTDTATGEE